MKYLLQPYDLLKRKFFRYLFVFGGAIFAFLFLTVFEPFGLHNLSPGRKYQAITLYAGAGMLLMYIQFFILQNQLIKKYTLLNTILWLMFSVLLIAASSTLINAFLFNNGIFYLKSYFLFLGIILSIHLLPVSIVILIHHNYILQKRLKASSRINQKLDVIDENSGHAKQVLLRSDNKNESMTISLKDLLFVKSIDNYVEVHFLKNGKHTFSILRYSLSKVERDNDALRELIRCHRSYIANRLHIEKISGNAAGYKIKLKKYEQLIPVSRKWNGKIEELITSG